MSGLPDGFRAMKTAPQSKFHSASQTVPCGKATLEAEFRALKGIPGITRLFIDGLAIFPSWQRIQDPGDGELFQLERLGVHPFARHTVVQLGCFGSITGGWGESLPHDYNLFSKTLAGERIMAGDLGGTNS